MRMPIQSRPSMARPARVGTIRGVCWRPSSVAMRAIRPPDASTTGPSLSKVERTSVNSRGLAGPTWAKARCSPSSTRQRPNSSPALKSARKRPGPSGLSVTLSGARRTARSPSPGRSYPASSGARLSGRRHRPVAAAPPPRGRAPSSANGRAGAAGRHAGRRPHSHAPRARPGRRAAARRGPCPRAAARAADRRRRPS